MRKIIVKLLTSDWPYWVGGVGIAVINIGLLALTGKPWGITTTVTLWGFKLANIIGVRLENVEAFREYLTRLADFNFWYGGNLLNVGLIFGVLVSAIISREFRFKKITGKRQVYLALLGGLLMGYGARLASGCNVGALVGGISSLSFHGWLFLIFALGGAWVGCQIMYVLLRRVM
ncbi:MAG: YeeE/YedE family protein [Thermoanaerobacteraceae bacterium]|nr:YeeE/YedE family protein [Thermoanaerobacteraceae bacterium]